MAETTIYEFKQVVERSKPKSWLKSVSAFANSSGGTLFFGIDNNGHITGLDNIRNTIPVILRSGCWQIHIKSKPTGISMRNYCSRSVLLPRVVI